MSDTVLRRGSLVLGIGLLLSVMVLVVWEPRSGGPGFWYFVGIGGAVSLLWIWVGSLIASRDRANPVGWLVLTLGLGFGVWGLVNTVGGALAIRLPGARIGAYVTWSAGILFAAIGLLPFVFFLFPNGHPLSPRWKAVIWVAAIAGALAFAAAVLTPDPDLNSLVELGIRVPNPVAIPALERVGGAISSTAATLFLLTGVLSVISLWLRYRRSAGDERQQIRWLAFVGGTAAALVVGFVLILIIDALGTLPDSSLFWFAFFIPFVFTLAVGIPLATGVAMLKYHLYDLDVVIKKTVQYALLIGAFAIVATVIVIAIPTLLVGLGGSQLVTVVVFATILALTFTWIRGPARRLADRIVYGTRATPYEVLSEFSERVGETYSADDVLPRMAAVLGEGAGADQATVWLRIAGAMRPAASWPAGAPDPGSVPDDGVDVIHQGETLGALSVRMPADDPMNPSKEKLVRDLAAQAGLVLRNVRLIEDLRDSRRRLVAAQDEERRKLERNIHDGAQQQLVALQVKLRLAEQLTGRDPVKASELLGQLRNEAGAAIEDLRDLARGIYPPLLADQGLAAALEAQARKAVVPTTVRAQGIGRYPQDVEAAIYFTCLEALQNTAKYAAASRATVSLRQADGHLIFAVTDDGRGFDPDVVGYGTGLQGIADRLETLGGALSIESAPGTGTTLTGTVATAVQR